MDVIFFLVPNCPLYYVGSKLSWCQIVRCQIVRCQIVLPPIIGDILAIVPDTLADVEVHVEESISESLATAWQQHCHRLKGNILKSLGHSLELACLKILFVDVVWTVSTGHLLWPNNQLSGIGSLWQWFYKPFACFYDCLKLGMVHNTAIYLIFLHGQLQWHNVSAKISTLGISWTLNTNIWFTDV